MKFRTHTQLVTASFRDVELAGAQGTITSLEYNGFTFGQINYSMMAHRGEYQNTLLSFLFLVVSIILLVWAVRSVMRARLAARQHNLKERLISSRGGVHA
jgi:uncharacterized membrane protein